MTSRDSGSCLGCRSHPRVFPAATELLTFEVIPYSYNRWVARVPWGQTTLHSWSYNLQHGWVWDTDHFPVNQLAHPYSGNLFFNSARSHGFDFWSSAPFALAGSLIWEYFGETTRPSINDLINTTIGGITLGETSFRLANLALDRSTTGGTRLVRELGAALIDPPLALARLVNGDMGRVEPNPVDRVPSRLASEFDLGYQRVTVGSPQSPFTGPNQLFAFYSLAYGDPLRGDVSHPFGALRLEGTIATGTAGTFSELFATGYLGTHDFLRTETANQQFQWGLNYIYLNNQAVLTGGQAVSGTLLSRYPLGRMTALRTDFSILGYAIDGVRSDFNPSPTAIANETARNYDYGMGGGARAAGRFEHNGHDLLTAAYSETWIGVLSGAARDHHYNVVSGRAEIPIGGRFALGGSALLYHRASRYASHQTVHARDARTQLFVGLRY